MNHLLTPRQAMQAAALLGARLGETVIAAAMLRAHEAAQRGATIEVLNWRRIAALALMRFRAA